MFDIYSRKIVGAEVFDAENAVNNEIVLRKALLRQGCVNKPPVVHSVNGSAMKGGTYVTGHVRAVGRDTVLQSAMCV
ncbi:hypothetical protein MRBBS_2508 [Marinobacter sp. BSs20148]|nr:hypothetical protein MRBBS_2508 [Marinobacter sp. BSs20148]